MNSCRFEPAPPRWGRASDARFSGPMPARSEFQDGGDRMSDYRIVVRVKNARILRAMERVGCETVAELCRRMGAPHREVRVGQLVNLRIPARSRNGTWLPLALAIAEALGCEPEDIFNERQQYQGIEHNVAHFDATEKAIARFISANEPLGLEERHEQNERDSLLHEMLSHLRPRERAVIGARFGLDSGHKSSLEETGTLIGHVSRERVRQLESRAISKLRSLALYREKDRFGSLVPPENRKRLLEMTRPSCRDEG